MTDVYSSWCQLVQSKLQNEMDKCRNWRVHSNTLFWTLLICFPLLISCFYFFSYFCLCTHCFKYFTFITCWIINKYNRKETDKVHGVCNKGNFQSQSITGTISNSEQECYSIWKSICSTIWNRNKCALGAANTILVAKTKLTYSFLNEGVLCRRV